MYAMDLAKPTPEMFLRRVRAGEGHVFQPGRLARHGRDANQQQGLARTVWSRPLYQTPHACTQVADPHILTEHPVCLRARQAERVASRVPLLFEQAVG